MKNTIKWVTGILAALSLAMPASGYAVEILQTSDSTSPADDWLNSENWGGVAVMRGNNYKCMPGLRSESVTLLGSYITSCVQVYPVSNRGSGTFSGGAITLAPGTVLLIKESGDVSANIVLNGGDVQVSGDFDTTHSTLRGMLLVTANSVLGAVGRGQYITVASSLAGEAMLRVAAGQFAFGVIFDDGVGNSLNSFAGIIDIGGGKTSSGTPQGSHVDFNQAYNMPLAGIKMGDHGTYDFLGLNADIVVGTFRFDGSYLLAGTYSAAALNMLYGDCTQFRGTGTLTVISSPVRSE